MKLRKQIRRRLTIVAAAVAGVGVLGAGAYVWRDRQIEARVAASYAEGSSLLKAGEFEPALHKIGRYVQRHPDDTAALLQYAEARRQVSMPNNRHLTDAMGVLRRVLDKDPANAAAAESLLNLYVSVGFNTEALDLADRVLNRDPANARALHSKAGVFYRTRRFQNDEALSAALAYQKAAPADLDGSLLVIEVLKKMDRPNERLAEWGRVLRATEGETLRTLFLSSVASASAQEIEQARAWARKAVLKDDPAATTVDMLRRQCDGLGMFNESTALLVRFDAIARSAESHRLLVARLFRLGRYADVIALQTADGKSPDPQSQVLRALAFARLEKAAEAASTLSVLETDTSKGASSWRTLGQALSDGGAGRDAEIIRAAQAILEADPSNAFARFCLAESYTRIGETDAAINAFKQVTTDAPAWAEPYVRLSWAARALGRADESTRLAQAAVDRNPSNRDALLAFAIARASTLKPNQSQEATQIRELLDRVDALQPSENMTLPIRVQVSALTEGRDAAVAAARTGMAGQAPAAPALMQLISVSQTFGLDLEGEAVERYEKTFGVSPELAYYKARRLFAEGKAQDGIALIDQGRSAAQGNAVEWSTVRAQFLELAGDPQAKDAWIQLADENPTNVKLQWLAVASRSVQGDRAFIGKVLDRLQAQLGNQGLTWRLARAQWLLDGQDSQSAVQAAMILNDITRGQPDLLAPRLLLADCLLRLKQETGAIEQLSAAANLQPQSATIALRLAQLLAQRGEQSKARDYLNRVLENPSATPDQRRVAADLVARGGDVDAALTALEKGGRANRAEATDSRLDLLKARLYWRAGKPERVEELCTSLLNAPTLESLAFVADFYASSGRQADADLALKQFDSASGSASEKVFLRAQYELRHGSRDAALKAFAEAAQLDPTNIVAFRQWIRAAAGLSTFEEAIAAAKVGVKQFPDDVGIKLFVERSDVVLAVKNRWPEAIELVVDLLENPSNADASAQALDLFRTRDVIDAPTATQVSKLASQFDRAAALQKAAVRALLVVQNPKDAASVAFRAMRAFPLDSSLAEMATIAYAAAEQWDSVLDAGTEWRRRIPGNPLPADVVLAAADTRLGNAARAVERLKVYVDRAQSEPERFADVILLLSAIDVSEGRLSAAADRLRPHLSRGPKWRLAWMQLAGRQIADASIASKWLTEVESLCDVAAVDERMALAQSWLILASRSHDRAAVAAGRKVGETLLGDNAAPGLLTAVGQLREADGDTKGAETLYREAVRREPTQAVAANNLAMILLTENRDLAEAEQLALTAATKAERDPNRPEYYDTLASILAKKGAPAEAAKAVGNALDLAPRRADFRIRQIRWLKDAGDLPAAKQALSQLDRQASAVAELPTPVQADLQALRQALAD